MLIAVAVPRLKEEALTARRDDEVTARFLRLAGRELDRAYRLAGMLLSDRSGAEDATQEALIRAWHARRSLRDIDGFQAWFDRILVNVCRDRLRRTRRVRFVELDLAPDHATRDPFRALLDADEVMRAMATLNDEQRLVVVLHYWADMTQAAIAERTGWPLGTVKSRLHAALRRLATRLRTVEGR